jgi:hypothetical protein
VPGDHNSGPVDDPLPATGEPGRATQPQPDVSRSATPNRRGWLVPVAVATAAIPTAWALGPTTVRTPPPDPASLPATVIVAPGRAELIVRDGDLVEASGSVEDETMCSPAPVPTVFGITCPSGIRVPGVSPTYTATLRGRWHPGWLSDIQRMPYAPTSAGELGPGSLPDTPPCPAPPGGWRDGEDYADDQVHEYLHAHADQFAEPFATHLGNARILVVQVVSGDVDQARAALTAIYADNLCVVAVPGGHSIAAENRLQATTGEALSAVMDDRTLGIYGVTSEDGKLRVMMVQLTQPLYDKFAAIGLDHLILDPWIRPARR